jgi:hypothetical protein
MGKFAKASSDGTCASAGPGGGPHTHPISDVTDLQTTLDGKAAVSHAHVKADVTDFAHVHPIGEVTNLQTSLDGKAATAHGHAIADVTNLQASLDGKSNTDHTHPGGSATPQFQLIVIANPITYTNAAAGGTEPAGQQSRVQADLRGAVNVVGQCLFSVIPHAASGKLHFQYSTNGGGAWSTLLDMGTGGYSANTLKVSAATAVPEGAKVVNALIRVIVHGDGVVDPVAQKACLMFQPA